MGRAGQFKPGQSGNPAGKPKGAAGLAKFIREQTNNGEDVVRFFLDLFKGEEVEDQHLTLVQLNKRIDRRVEAAKWLVDRGFGQAAQIIIEDNDMLADVDQDELAFFHTLTEEEKKEYVAHEKALQKMRDAKKKKDGDS